MRESYYAQKAIQKIWTLADAVQYVAEYFLDLGCFEDKQYSFMLSNIKKIYMMWLHDDIVDNNVALVTRVDDLEKIYNTAEGFALDAVDFVKSTIEVSEFIRWASTKTIPIPGVLARVTGGQVSSDESNVSCIQTPGHALGEDQDALVESKYPEFKGIKRDELTDEQFTSLKQFYKIARNEESKLRKAVAIAAKIGLLFYERGLGKPTTRPAFINLYKKEFDSMLRNNTVAGLIYDSLPEEYKGGSGAPETTIDIDPIIRAAVFAGFKEGTDGDVTGNELVASLRDEGYEIPDEITLQKIQVAMLNLR